MDLLDRLAQQLDEQIKPKDDVAPQMTQEIYEALIEKKMNDMELRLNATINKLIEQNNTNQTTNETLEETTEQSTDKVEEGEKI